MRFSKLAVFLVFSFYFVLLVHGKVQSNELRVSSGNSFNAGRADHL
ncbi:hypothetical protein PRUPE_6G175400 [Prunus persica]|uniref:Uncharacterized protein n=1 Tax=Prunus persica TaxID=3760 RepID=A0A251NRU9_PRUPE|nr:hypothetical protein PRUPE_6G175400 [Prunus persica]